MEKLENSKLGILSTLLLSIQEEGEELSLTHSLTKHWLPSSISQDLLQWSGEMNIAKQAVCKKNTRAKQNLVEMSGSTKAPTRHHNWMTKRRGKGCSGLA